VQSDIVQVHSAALHPCAESLVRFGLESVKLCPADVEAVKAVGPKGRIGGWIKNSCFVEELLKVRGCQGLGPFRFCILCRRFTTAAAPPAVQRGRGGDGA
jgi:urocanate hydratase